MATQPTTGLTYEDLARFPEDNFRRHQRAVAFLTTELVLYARQHGGEALPAPTDVFFTDANVVEPDVLFVGPQHSERVERKFVRSAPDIVVEVSSPSTRRLELVRKLRLYERFAVPEYWYVDLEADRVEVYQMKAERFAPPSILGRADRLSSPQLPGWSVAVDELVGHPEGP